MGRWCGAHAGGQAVPRRRPRRRQLTAKARDVEAGPAGQRAEGTLAEDPDAGGQSEQRRRVERDAEPRGLGAPGRAEAAQVVIAPSMERIAPVT